MKEILGGNLKRFFDTVDSKCNNADITYAGDRYEVWEVSDELFKQMCDMTEEKFVELAGEYAWWRSAEGSILDIPCVTMLVNGHVLKCWGKERDYDGYSDYCGFGCESKYESLSDYLCNCVGASQPKNVCACAMDLAKYNSMSMGELFRKYEG